jgi:C-terminal processing protease CtpA/Prc
VRVPEILTMLAQDEEGDFAEDRNDGLIGGELLRRFARVVVDYAHRRVILEPQAEVGQPPEFDASGLSLVAAGPDFRSFRVRLVLPSSPAEEAGIEPGDVLLTFDGRPAAEYGLEELRRVLRRPGGRHTMTLEREGSTVETAITTRRLI